MRLKKIDGIDLRNGEPDGLQFEYQSSLAGGLLISRRFNGDCHVRGGFSLFTHDGVINAFYIEGPNNVIDLVRSVACDQ